MTKVLVTGYGGFLGKTIVGQLVAAGYSVRGLARGSYPELAAMGVEPVRGDIADRQTVLDACQGCEAVIHTAAKAGVWGGWQEYYRANVLATEHLLEGAGRAGLRAFVYTSSPSVTFGGQHQSGVDESVGYPQRWLCYYPQTKAMAEQSVLAAGRSGRLRSCALRPHLIWGQGDPHLFPRVVQRARQGRLRRVGSGENLIDVVHVEAAAQAHVLALHKLLQGDEQLSGQPLFLTDGQPVACWAWIRRILELAHVPVPTKSISFAAAYRIGWLLEMAYAGLRCRSEPPMTRFVAAQLAMDHYFDISRARRWLGYEPASDLNEKFEQCGDWLRGCD
jgi:2-alkyl-3-oxoalkanoate reductase